MDDKQYNDAMNAENEAMNFLTHCDAPMELCTSQTLVGTSHFMMASILEGYIFSSCPLITYPRYTKY